MSAKRFFIVFWLTIASSFYISCAPKSVSKTLTPVAVVLDGDSDGVNDSDDKCPDISGLVSLFGCPDRDGDGIADGDDKCPDIKGISKYEGCPVPDSDNDGVNDELDSCPTIPGNSENNGCPTSDVDGDGDIDLADEDRDGDNVPDADDKCPDVYGNSSNNGCPPERKKETKAVYQKTENVNTEVANNSSKKTATLGYSYYTRMKQNETKNFRVFVKIDGQGNIIYREIRNREAIEGADDYNTDTSKVVILPYNVELYKKLKIILEADSEDFKITPQTPEEQELDMDNGTHWHWHLRATAASERIAQVTMKISAITPDGEIVSLPQKQVKIKIAINKPEPVHVSFWTKILDWIGNHIEYVLGSVIVPSGLWLYGQRRRGKKDIPSAPSNDNMA